MKEISPGTIQMVLDPHHFAYETGVALTGVSFTQKPAGWQVIFRGNRHNGAPVYCLYLAVTLFEALTGLCDALSVKGGSRMWYPDKYR